MRIRTEYSTNFAYGKLTEVFKRLSELEYKAMPISDRYSTFGWIEWNELCTKYGKQPIFGVELGVSNNAGDKRASVSNVSFFATDNIKRVNDLVAYATAQTGSYLTYSDVNSIEDLVIVVDNRAKLDLLDSSRVYVALSPSIPIGYYRKAKELGFRFIQSSDNVFIAEENREEYRVLMGRNAYSATYNQFIETPTEWNAGLASFVDRKDLQEASYNRILAERRCTAMLNKPNLPKIDTPMNLWDMCMAGMVRLGVPLEEPYKSRLIHELTVIADKHFEDYFYIVAELMQWARQRMVVAPGRGSSAGSLVCYLLGITSVDPIKYDLLFERFLDPTRKDLPDIDMDFDDNLRPMVFAHLEQLYGKDHFGKICAVTRFRPKTIINTAGTQLRIPVWLCQKAAEELHEHGSFDDRALHSFAETFKFGEYSQRLLNEYPEISLVFNSELHTKNFSVHAAGAVITDQDISNFVAVDSRNDTIMADKNTAEKLGLLKLDILGLAQLSVFGRALELAGFPSTNAFLETIPLDDEEAFAVINQHKYSGLFQMGNALIKLFKQFHVRDLEDIIAVTSLARPGPLMAGGAQRWVDRRIGYKPIEYAHECLKPYLKTTFGELVYQEQLMQIAAHVGGMSVEDVTALRKAVAKSKGAEALRPFGDKFKQGAARFGFIGEAVDSFWNDLCGFGAYSFNRCLDGETLVERDGVNKYCNKHETIAYLYKLQNDRRANTRQSASWRNKNIKLISLFEKEERGFSNKALNIIYNGEKDCNKYTFDDGSFVICTANHKFIVSGNWKEIGLAVVGEEFTCLRINTQKEINERNYQVKGTLGKSHAKGKHWDIDNGDNDRTGYTNVSFTTGVSHYFAEFKKTNKNKPCEDCGAIDTSMEAHHCDFNEGKDDPQFLAWLCASCHKKRHYKHGRTKRGQIGRVKYYKKLVSVEHIGMRDTYDIEMNEHHNFQLSNGLVTHNSHAVSYSLITYYCCWLKAFHPVEFAAATLDAETDPEKQIKLLRELHSEGIGYIPIDPEISGDRWTIKEEEGKGKILVGPLTSIKGIGPAKLAQIIEARQSGKELPPGLAKQLREAITPIDSLTPVSTAVARCIPDLSAVNIVSKPTPIARLEAGDRGTFMIIGLLVGLKKKDRNDAESLARRKGKRVYGNSLALNLTFRDDSGADIVAIIDPKDFADAAPNIIERGGIDKAIYAVKGTIPDNFRMLSIQGIRYLCNVDDGLRPIENDWFSNPQNVSKEDYFTQPQENSNGTATEEKGQ